MPKRLVDEWRLKKGPGETVDGEVVRAAPSNTRVNKRRVWEHDFTYRTHDNVERKGTAYLIGHHWQRGTVVRVRYLTAEPDTAMPEGARLDMTPPWLMFVAIFPLAGLAIIITILRQRRISSGLLRNGVLGSAVVDEVTNTSAQINGHPVHRVRIRLTDTGESFQRNVWNDAEVGTLLGKLRAGEPVQLLYDPKNPKRHLFPESWDDHAGSSVSQALVTNRGARRVGKPPALRDEVEQFLGIPTPRRIPKWLAKQYRNSFSDWIVRGMGTIFLAVGLAGASVVLPWHLFDQWRLDSGESLTSPGKITELTDPKVSIGSIPVRGYNYTFQTADGRTHSGKAYTNEPKWEPGQEITVRHLQSQPSVSVPEGARMGPTTGAFLSILIFPAIGAALLFIPLLHRAKRNAILRRGRVAAARVESMKDTNVRINGRPRYAVRLLHEDGTVISIHAHRPAEVQLATRKMQDEEALTILQHPMKPQRLVIPEAW